jgi:hypothetical protein
MFSREEQARMIVLTATGTHGYNWQPAMENGLPVIAFGTGTEITEDLVAAMAFEAMINGRGVPCNSGAVRDATMVLRGQATTVPAVAA